MKNTGGQICSPLRCILMGCYWVDVSGARLLGMPPQAFARAEAMSDKLHALMFNPWFTTAADERVTCQQVCWIIFGVQDGITRFFVCHKCGTPFCTHCFSIFFIIFLYLYVCHFIHALSFIHSFNFMYTFIIIYNYLILFIYVFIFVHLFIHLFIYSFIHSLIHSFID